MKNYFKKNYVYAVLLLTFASAGSVVYAITTTGVQVNVDGSELTANNLMSKKVDHAHSFILTEADISPLDASKITTGTFGTAFIADGAVTSAKISTGAITNVQVHDVAASKITGTIAASQIAAGTITDTQIHDVAASKITGTITASQIATETITDLEIHDVSAAKITGTIASTQIANLDASKITTGTFGTAQIATGAITDAQIHDVAGSKITGTVAAVNIANLDASKITTGTIDSSRIGAVTVADGSITTAKLADGAVTNAKINDVAAVKITGTIAAANIANLDASKITTGTIDSARIGAVTVADGSITTVKLADSAVTDAKINDVAAGKITGTIASTQIADNAVTDTKVVSVSGSKITGTVAAANIASLDASKITTGTFGSARIAAGVITSGNLATNSVTNTKVASLAITDAKINDVAAGKITGTIASTQIANLDTSKITTGTFGSARIAPGAIIGSHIANNSITNAQIHDVDASKITGTVDASRIAQLSVQNISGLQTQLLSIVVSGQELLIDQDTIFIRPFTYFEPGSFLRWNNLDGFKTAHWESILPAECTIDLQGEGVLELNADLILKGAGTFKTLGTLRSNEVILNQSENAERTIELSKYTSLFPKCSAKNGIFKSVTLILNSDITLNAKIVVNNRLRIKGNGYSITFNNNAQIVVPEDSFLYLQDVIVKDISSYEELQQNGQVHEIIDGIVLQEDGNKKSHLVLENSTLIPKVKRAYFKTGIIELLDNNCRLGGQGKSIDIKQSDFVGNGGSLLEFKTSSYSVKSPITSCIDFGQNVTLVDDVDLRGSGFLNPTKVDLNGNTMMFDCCSYPSGPSIDINRTVVMPSLIVPDEIDDFNASVDSIISTQDTDLPIIGLVHKGNNEARDPSKIVFGIVNPYTKKFIKGAEISIDTGNKSDQIIDIVFRKGQPLEISEEIRIYDRYCLAVLYGDDRYGSSSLVMYALDIDQEFYKTDIADPTQSDNYQKIGTFVEGNNNRLGRMSIKKLGQGVNELKNSLNAFINVDAHSKILAIASHPCGKELAVFIEKNIESISSYELCIYQMIDSGKIFIDKVVALKNNTIKPLDTSLSNPLQWTVDGKFLLVGSIENDQYFLQSFFKKDGILEKTFEYPLDSPAIFAVHPYSVDYVAIAQNNFLNGNKSGVEILTLNDNGILIKEPITFVPFINNTVFNNLEWNQDGNLLAAGTEQGVKLVPFNCNHHVYQPVDNGFYNELSIEQSIKAAKFIGDGTRIVVGGQYAAVAEFLAKPQGELANGMIDFYHNFACIVPTVITQNLTLNLNQFTLDIPATGSFIINSGVTLTIKNATIKSLSTKRHSLDSLKMVNEVAGFVFKDPTSTLVLDASNLYLSKDIDFVAAGNIRIKTKDSTVYNSILRVPNEGRTKLISSEGYSFVADTVSASMVSIGVSNNNIDQSKSLVSSFVNQQTIRSETTLAAASVQAFSEGQQQKNSFERSSDGSRTPLTIVGSENSDDPLRYPLKDYMELLGSGPGNVTINGYVRIEGPITVQDSSKSSLVENTTIRVENGARLVVKTGSVLTCTGQMSLVAGVNGLIVIEDNGLLQFGSYASKDNDQLNLLGDGGEIELQGPRAKICFSYGQNKIVMNHRSSIDTVDDGQILFNQTAQGVSTCKTDGTIGSTLVEFTLNKTKIVGSPETNDAVFIIAPNDQVAGIENTTILNVKNIQCTGNTNTQFMAANGKKGVAAVLNALDQKQTVNTAQLVERLTLAELPKNNQPINPARFDAHGDIQAASAVTPLFSYTLYNTDKLYSIRRYTMHTGQEVVSGTDMFGHAFSQFNGSARINT